MKFLLLQDFHARRRRALFAILAVAGGLTLSACTKTPAVPAAAAPPPTDAAAAPLQLAPQVLRDAGVTIAAAGPATLRETLPLYGRITPVAERIRRVSARFPGMVKSVLKAPGDPVRNGEKLAIVESNDSLEPYAITAPLSGTVLERLVNPGEALEQQTLFVIGDLSSVWAELAVFRRDAARVHAGLRVDVRAAEGGTAQRSEIVYLAAQSDAASQSLTARAVLANADRRWTSGQFISAEVVLAETPVAVAVPQSAVQQIDAQSVVFVETAAGFRLRPLQLGRQDRDYAEVLGGLAAGERIVVTNSYLLKSTVLTRGE